MRKLVRPHVAAMLSFVLLAVSPALPAGTAAGPQSAEIGRALEEARVAFEGGSIPIARYWAERASALLAAADVECARPRTYPLGNASQLLEVLAIYTVVADGTHPDLDAQAEWLITQLETIRWLDERSAKPDRLGERSIDYAPFTNLVRRLGEIAIDRDPFTQQIRRIADVVIDYHPFTLEPRRIGAITVDYDPWSRALRAIAGISVQR